MTGHSPALAGSRAGVLGVSVTNGPWAPGRLPPPPPARSATGASFTAWIVRIIMLATTGFALFDLYLLASSVHH